MTRGHYQWRTATAATKPNQRAIVNGGPRALGIASAAHTPMARNAAPILKEMAQAGRPQIEATGGTETRGRFARSCSHGEGV